MSLACCRPDPSPPSASSGCSSFFDASSSTTAGARSLSAEAGCAAAGDDREVLEEAPSRQRALASSQADQRPAPTASACMRWNAAVEDGGGPPVSRVMSAPPACAAAPMLPLSSTPQRSFGSCSAPMAPAAPRLLLLSRLANPSPSPSPQSTRSDGNSKAQQLSSWELDITAASTEQMIQICHDVFSFSGVVDHFGLDTDALGSFFAAVASRYRDIPYHNLNHAVHVLHGTWMVLQCPSAARLLSWEDRLSLLVAALVHDLDHDGHSNSYHMHTHSDLARQYGDRSVMEHHHCAVALEVLGKENCALLVGDGERNLSCDQAGHVRESIVDAILSTDMDCHFSMTRDFCTHAPEFDPVSVSDRCLLRAVILHAVDVGAAARPLRVNDALSARIHREFHELAEKETQLGIPVTLAVDCDDPVSRAQVEVGFLDFIVLPLWEKLATVVPELAPALATIKHNREHYAALAAACTAERRAAAGEASEGEVGGPEGSLVRVKV